ncbi:MAG: hypothetical protein V1905_04140 [bacterium]
MVDQLAARSPEARRDDEVRERPRENKENYDEPWAELRIEEEERIVSGQKKVVIGNETFELGKQLMAQKADQETVDFARYWFDDNKAALGDRGYVIPENPSDDYIIRVTKEAGGFDELKNDPDYERYNKRIEGAYALRKDLEKGAKSIESQTILMYELGKEEENKKDQISDVDTQIEQAKEKRPPNKKELAQLTVARTILEVELKQIDKSVREIYVCMNGKTPEEMVIGDDRVITNAEAITERKANVKERQKRDANNLEGWQTVAERLGYVVTQVKGRFGPEYIVSVKNTGQEVRRFGLGRIGNVGRFLHQLEVKFAVSGTIFNWQAEQNKLKEDVKSEIDYWKQTPDEATEGVEQAYDRVRERLVTEHIQETRKKDPKSKEQLKAIEQEFQGEGLNATEFIDTVVARKGGLADLSGRWESDQAAVKEFAESWGVPVGGREWEEFAKKQKGIYERRVKTRRGFIDWMIDMVLSTSDKKKDNTGRRQTGGNPQNRPATGAIRGTGSTASGSGQGQPATQRPGTRRPVTRKTPPAGAATQP